MLVHVRTCPYQSWQNIAERVMSTLNLALQNVSLSRSSMPSEFETLICHKNTLGDVRKEIKKKPKLSDALHDAMASPMIAVGERFKYMKIKETPIKLGVLATEEDITDFFSHSAFIDPDSRKLTKADLEKCKSLQDFLKHHSHSSQYVFQLKKCTSSECYYCLEHPVRLPASTFEKLSYLPLLLFDATKEHYMIYMAQYLMNSIDLHIIRSLQMNQRRNTRRTKDY